MSENNYTLGRGKVYFAKFTSGETPGPFLFLGNCPEFNLTMETEDLEHYSSVSGVREVDDSTPLTLTRTGSIVCDAIKPENLELFFFGSLEKTTATALSNQTETITAPKAGETYQLGLSATDLIGHRGVTVASVGSLTEGTDYEVDGDNGMVTFLADQTGNQVVTFSVAAKSYTKISAGTSPIQGALRFLEDNPKGDDNEWIMPKATIKPNGDISLLGDEWRQIPYGITVEKPSGGAAIYINGVPST